MPSLPPPLEYAAEGESAATVWARRLAVALVFFPLLLLMAVYGGWLAAWAVIGHQPEPIFDDPALLGPVVNVAILPAKVLLPAAWLVFILHMALVGSVFYKTLAPGSPFHRKLAVLAAAVSTWAAAFVLLNVDPGEVLKWAGLTPP